MANNRMVLLCMNCIQKEETTLEDCVYYILKYYPSSGWYWSGEDSEMGSRVNEWLKKHIHGSFSGEYLFMVPERVIDPASASKIEILGIVAKYLSGS